MHCKSLWIKASAKCINVHVMKIIPLLAAIPGFQQRWRQRGKTYGLQRSAEVLTLLKNKQTKTLEPE